MPKSSKKRKNGKVKKYTPKPKGISKKKLDMLLQQFKQQGMMVNSKEVAEVRMDDSTLQIEDDSKKSYNVISTEEKINEGPELSSDEISLDEK